MSINPQRSQAVNVGGMIILTAFGRSLYSDRETYNGCYLTEKAEAYLCRPHNGQQVGAETRGVRRRRLVVGYGSSGRRPVSRRWTSPTSWGSGYYTFISQIENGFGRVPSQSMGDWARALGLRPSQFARVLLGYYDPALFHALFEDGKE